MPIMPTKHLSARNTCIFCSEIVCVEGVDACDTYFEMNFNTGGLQQRGWYNWPPNDIELCAHEKCIVEQTSPIIYSAQYLAMNLYRAKCHDCQHDISLEDFYCTIVKYMIDKRGYYDAVGYIFFCSEDWEAMAGKDFFK